MGWIDVELFWQRCEQALQRLILLARQGEYHVLTKQIGTPRARYEQAATTKKRFRLSSIELREQITGVSKGMSRRGERLKGELSNRELVTFTYGRKRIVQRIKGASNNSGTSLGCQFAGTGDIVVMNMGFQDM